MFKSRTEAGKLLGEKVREYVQTLPGNPDLDLFRVVAIPRGGVVVGKEVADALGVPLIPLVVKKISHQSHLELALGAVGPLKTIIWDEEVLKNAHLTQDEKQKLLEAKERERDDREVFLGIETCPDVANKQIFLVDDGVATGSTVLVARESLSKMSASKVFLATPVISADTAQRLSRDFDGIIELSKPESFYAVGEFYLNFPQVEDETVKRILSSPSRSNVGRDMT